MALTQEVCDRLLAAINEALLEDKVETLSLSASILTKYSEPWPSSREEIYGIVDYILSELGEEDNAELRLLLLPAY